MASTDAAITQLTQGLECCLCYELFTQPKLLTCAHTFCKQCLVNLYECHPQQNQLSCPICRQITNVNNGDISKLQTNILIHSIVEDMKAAERSCNICDPEAKSHAVQYCAQCDKYMCDPCAWAHGRFKKSTIHDVVSVDDVKKGKVKVKRFCTKHPGEEKLYVCTSCNMSICFRCRVIDHSKPNHNIEEVSSYKKTIQKQIQSLKKKSEATIAIIEAHKELVEEQKAVVEGVLDQKIAEINQTYEEAVRHLTRQRDNLIDECKQKKTAFITQLRKIKESDDIEISCIRSAYDLVGNGIKTLLDGQTLTVHNTIRCDLEKMLDESNLDSTQPKSIADHAKRVKFTKRGTPASLGELQLADWQLKMVSSFPLSHEGTSDAVPLPDGRLAVGYWDGDAIEMFAVDGGHETVLRGVKVQCLSVLSDGRYAVLDDCSNITLYTQAWEKLKVEFNTTSIDDGVWHMCTDSVDNIYVSYRETKKIAVFRPEGGRPFREIPCQDYDPFEICHMNHNKRLVVCDGQKSVRVIGDTDEKGTIFHCIQVDGQNTRIAVLKDDSILIACGYYDDNLLCIELYSKDLEGIRSVLPYFPLLDHIATLFEIPTREIVVISQNKITVLDKI